jgi:hypothetical protein
VISLGRCGRCAMAASTTSRARRLMVLHDMA